MTKQPVFVFALLAAGVVAGILITADDPPDTPNEAATPAQSVIAPDAAPVANPFAPAAPVTAQPDPVRLQRLEERIVELTRRIGALERSLASAAGGSETADTAAEIASAAVSTRSNSGGARGSMPSIDALVNAGIDPELANDIVRRKNEIELKKLELRDRASRENYLGTGRYNRELAELTSSDVSLREELGDEYYDNYLYQAGQNNRVLVTSVMLGSQAEYAGMQDGDIILSYDGQTLFEWRALQQATTLGQRGEYVNMNIQRGEKLLNLWIPRGPLGVRLSSTRLEP